MEKQIEIDGVKVSQLFTRQEEQTDRIAFV